MKYLICFISCLILFSCSTDPEGTINIETTELTKLVEENETEADNVDKKLEAFRSELRVGKTDWNEEDTYADTLELVEYNTDADYYFVVLKDRVGKEVIMQTNVEINDFYLGRNYLVHWKIGEFYEAGENDASYYSEEMISLDLLNSSFSFENHLSDFFEAYKSGNQTDIKKHIHPLVDMVSTYNPAMYCVNERPVDIPPLQEYFKDEYIITSEKPVGDFCSGYEGVQNGLYYEFFDETHDLFPKVYDMSGEGVEKTLHVTEDVLYQYFVKITVITDDYFNRHLYFFKELDRWYFWVEDFCDCSL